MFVEVSGFAAAQDVDLPESLYPASTSDDEVDDDDDDDDDDNKKKKIDTVVLALVRWLSPHPNAIVRDPSLRPVAPPPLDINHCLWEFTKQNLRRDSLSGRLFTPQLHMFPGKSRQERVDHATSLRHARYDLLTLDSLGLIMNCTCIDNDPNTILETVTLPFA